MRRATTGRLGLALALLAGAATAAPEVSPRPQPSPFRAAPEVSQAGPNDPRGRDRPAHPLGSTAGILVTPAPAAEATPRPEERPFEVEGVTPVMSERPAGPTVCGDPTIEGVRIAPVPGRIQACGIDEPVQITAAGGLALSRPIRVDCPTARALSTWAQEGVRPATRGLGGGAVGLRVAAGYACRTRNNQAGARVSEHGRGRAVDVSGVLLRGGALLTVEDGWKVRRLRRRLRQMHEAACGPFGTVLGPEADQYHQDHFHLDTASYRSGPYCR